MLSNEDNVQYGRLGQQPDSNRKKNIFAYTVLALGLCAFIALCIIAAVGIKNRKLVDPDIVLLQQGFDNIDLQSRLSNTKLSVSGSMPKHLTGHLLVNTPAHYKSNSSHWFDGLSLLHRFNIQNGKVSYSHQFVASTEYNDTIGVPATQDAPNTNFQILKVDGHYLVSGVTGKMNEFDPETLDTLSAPFNGFDGDVMDSQQNPPYLARDADGVLYHYTTLIQPDGSHVYRLYKIVDRTHVTIGDLIPQALSSPLPPHRSLYQHSLLVSQSYLVLIESIIVGDGENWLNYTRDFDLQTSVRLFNKADGQEVGSFVDQSPSLVFYPVHAYEEEDKLVFDAVAYPCSCLLGKFSLDKILTYFNNTPQTLPSEVMRNSRLMRYTVSPKDPKMQVVRLSPEKVAMEFGTVAPSFQNQPNRFVYAASFHDYERSVFYDQLVKLDLETQKTETFDDVHTFVSAPVFVQDEKRKDKEDGGWLLSVILDGKAQVSSLLVLDAEDMSEVARATLKTKGRNIPLSFNIPFFEHL